MTGGPRLAVRERKGEWRVLALGLLGPNKPKARE